MPEPAITNHETSPVERLRALPRAMLANWPTPLHRLERFTEAVGAEIWIKRDDIGSVGLAGNKVRKYELVLGAAREDGADVLVTTGAKQSNSARTGAVAAASLGMDCVLVLSGEPPEIPTANLLLDHLAGAELVFAGDVGWRDLDDRVDAIASELRARGRRPVVAPVGCSSPLGSLGFALAALELDTQVRATPLETAPVYFTSTSGGTASGLAVGSSLLGHPRDLCAVDAGRLTPDPAGQITDLATEAAAMIGADLGDPPLTVDLDQMGRAYGAPTETGTEAIHLLARTEGIFCDPVYSAKGLAGLVADARGGKIEDRAIFWHTGGWHALFDDRMFDLGAWTDGKGRGS